MIFDKFILEFYLNIQNIILKNVNPRLVSGLKHFYSFIFLKTFFLIFQKFKFSF